MKFTSEQVAQQIDVNWDNPKTRLTFRNSYIINEMLDMLRIMLLLIEKESK